MKQHLVLDFDWADGQAGIHATAPDGELTLVEAQTYSVAGDTVCDDSVAPLGAFDYVLASDAVRALKLRARSDWFVFTHDARELRGRAALAYLSARARLAQSGTVDVASLQRARRTA